MPGSSGLRECQSLLTVSHETLPTQVAAWNAAMGVRYEVSRSFKTFTFKTWCGEAEGGEVRVCDGREALKALQCCREISPQMSFQVPIASPSWHVC
jgi:hypothetical protein